MSETAAGRTFEALLEKLHAPVYSARLRELVRSINPHLKRGDRVLDVGCGSGALGKALLDSPACPPLVGVEGLERRKRGNEPIEVHAYDGQTIPFADDSFDVVILADVLHHEPDLDLLLSESRRVARRLIIIKDHQLKGPLANIRVSLIDWAANAAYQVPCLYRYNTPAQWSEIRHRHALELVEEQASMNLYPTGLNVLFGRGLQYFAVLSKDESCSSSLTRG